jgi:hypothetical protein
MTGVLDLTDARAKLDRARELHGELVTALNAWVDSGGVEAQSRRSFQFVCYIGYAKVNAPPPINLPLRAGEVLHSLRTALDYTAFQIYLVGGGTPDGPDAHKVAFPIVTEPSKWEGVVARKVPGVWAAAVDELRAVQQSVPPRLDSLSRLPPIDPLLSRLATLGGTDKHRNLSLFATGAWSQSVIAPESKAWYSTVIQIGMPGPLLPTAPGPKVEVSRVFIQPNPAPYHDSEVGDRRQVRAARAAAVVIRFPGQRRHADRRSRIAQGDRPCGVNRATVRRTAGTVKAAEAPWPAL